MPPKYKFQEGEKVLCFHGPLIYEAKCLKSSLAKDGKQIKYFIHYAGWNKNWDEWVPEERVLKFNDTNVQRQKEVQKVHEQASKQSRKSGGASKIQGRRSDGGRQDKEKDSDSRASTPVALLERTPSRASKSGGSAPTSSNDSPLEAPRKKRGRPEPSDDIEPYTIKSEIRISIPDDLKCHLIDECDAITKEKKLPSLPMSKTVDKVLEDYVEAIENEKIDGVNKESAAEITKGIKEYFNVSINLQLLYGWERPQFEEMVPEDSEVSPSQIYGPYHLLRLFVKLGDMLSYTMLDEKSAALLLKHFNHFLQYLQKNSSTIFDLSEYKDPPPDYNKKFPK